MTFTTTLFPPSNFIGFDQLYSELEQTVRRANDRYPPHNVLKLTENQYLIELAVAGFTSEELSIEVNNRTLTVSGEQTAKNREYIHQGISTKKFTRTFTLAEHVSVNSATIKNGMLCIELARSVPEEMRPRKIQIIKRTETENYTY